ncbi:MAG: YetF domain-containing protein [Moorellales bacterium]
MVYARLLGKQQVGQLTFYEYVNGITFGSIAAVLATDAARGRMWLHFVGLTLFAALTYLMGLVAIKSRPARRLIAGEPTIVVHNGKILEENMRKMRYNLDELIMQLREKDIFNLADVEFAILEPNGSLSVLPKSQKRPLTPADLAVPTGYEGLASELIMDGQVIFQNLKQNHLSLDWLRQELAKRGITDLGQVAYAALNTDGSLYVDLKADQLQQPVDITDLPEPPAQPPPTKPPQ